MSGAGDSAVSQVGSVPSPRGSRQVQREEESLKVLLKALL